MLNVLKFFMQRSFIGFKLVVSGHAPRAARYAGFASSQAIWLGLLIGGAAAGLAGVGEVAGPIGQLPFKNRVMALKTKITRVQAQVTPYVNAWSGLADCMRLA